MTRTEAAHERAQRARDDAADQLRCAKADVEARGQTRDELAAALGSPCRSRVDEPVLRLRRLGPILVLAAGCAIEIPVNAVVFQFLALSELTTLGISAALQVVLVFYAHALGVARRNRERARQHATRGWRARAATMLSWLPALVLVNTFALARAAWLAGDQAEFGVLIDPWVSVSLFAALQLVVLIVATWIGRESAGPRLRSARRAASSWRRATLLRWWRAKRLAWAENRVGLAQSTLASGARKLANEHAEIEARQRAVVEHEIARMPLAERGALYLLDTPTTEVDRVEARPGDSIHGTATP